MVKKKTTRKKTAKKKPAGVFDWITEDLRPLATPMDRATVEHQRDPAHIAVHRETDRCDQR